MNRRNFPLFKPQPAPRLVKLGTRLLAVNIGATLLLAAAFWLVGMRPNPATAVGPRYVATSGSDTGNTCLDWNAPCRTIQHAVDQAASGEEIRVAAGTYAGRKSFALWAEELPGNRIATTVELPYASVGSAAVTAKTARAFGRDLARALRLFLDGI